MLDGHAGHQHTDKILSVNNELSFFVEDYFVKSEFREIFLKVLFFKVLVSQSRKPCSK